MAKHWINAAVLIGVAGLLAAGSARRGPSLVSAPADGVAQLEQTVARHPGDEHAVRSLMKVYLDRNEPGLAVAVAQRAPAAVVASATSTDLAARAYLGAGRASESLTLTRRALAQCAAESCDATMMARASRREQLLEAMQELGIEDADKNPEAVELAYRKSARTVRVALN